jgi:hypothetical protein
VLPELLPRNLKKAVDLLQNDPARSWTVAALAVSCDIPRRTLEKHFRRHLHQTPVEYLRTALPTSGLPCLTLSAFLTECPTASRASACESAKRGVLYISRAHWASATTMASVVGIEVA